MCEVLPMPGTVLTNNNYYYHQWHHYNLCHLLSAYHKPAKSIFLIIIITIATIY